MDKEIMAYIHNGVLFSCKEKVLCSGKWTELEIIMLSKISQT
jgi:hypothetical protein